MKLFKVNAENYKLLEFDSRVGLNGSQCHWKFPCLSDSGESRFYVWIGNATVDKFTKSTFMNLVDFAEKEQAKTIILVQARAHP